MTASAKPGNIGTSFEITLILSLPDEIVKRFAKVGPDAGLRGCSSFFCKFEIKRKAQGEHLTNSLPCAQDVAHPDRVPYKRGAPDFHREDLFRDRSYFKHPRRDRQAFCEDRVGFGVGGVFAAGEPPKKQKKKERQQLARKPWLLITGDPKLNSYIAQRSMLNICGNCQIVNKRKPRPLAADAG